MQLRNLAMLRMPHSFLLLLNKPRGHGSCDQTQRTQATNSCRAIISAPSRKRSCLMKRIKVQDVTLRCPRCCSNGLGLSVSSELSVLLFSRSTQIDAHYLLGSIQVTSARGSTLAAALRFEGLMRPYQIDRDCFELCWQTGGSWTQMHLLMRRSWLLIETTIYTHITMDCVVS